MKKNNLSLFIFKFHCRRILAYGLVNIILRIIQKIILFFLAIILFPISCILYFCNVRRLYIFSDRIGHLALEPDTLIKAQILGIIKPKRWIILAPCNRVAN